MHGVFIFLLFCFAVVLFSLFVLLSIFASDRICKSKLLPLRMQVRIEDESPRTKYMTREAGGGKFIKGG
jgi:hypothetical protein